VVSRPSVVTVSSFGRQKLIENMTRVSVYAFKQVIVSFLKVKYFKHEPTKIKQTTFKHEKLTADN